MNIELNRLADYLVNEDANEDEYVRSQYDKLIAERDTSDVWRQFAIWFLVDPDHGVIRFTKPDSKQHAAIQNVARLYAKNCKDRNAWRKATSAAWDANSASIAEALAAATAAAARDAIASAWAAVAAAVAYAAPASAAAAAATAAAYADYAHVAAYKHMAEKLLELLQLAPPKETP